MVSFLLLLLYLNDDLRTAFQDGCKKIVDHLTTLGYPPEDPQGPDEINAAIDSIYNNRYAQGYEDGVNKTAANAKIKYTYHKHVNGSGATVSAGVVYSMSNPGGCYRAAGHQHDATGPCPTHTTPGSQYLYCTVCGWSWALGGSYTACPSHPGSTVLGGSAGKTEYVCGNFNNVWRIGCGKTTSTIEKAEIIF